MEVQLAILVTSFLLLLMMEVPVAVVIGMSAWLTIFSLGTVPASYVVAQRMSTGIASFPLLAIPFFVLAGQLMGAGGMARRLIEFAVTLVGGYRGGLAYVNTLTCMMFGSISGSATAAVSSIGGMMIPEMRRKGYDRDFSVALTATAATTGLVIPPSNIMIVFAVVAGNVSIATLFMAGVIPGILIGLCIMAVCWIEARRRGLVAGQRATWGQVFRAGRAALPSLLLVIIVLAGILGGVFSATEAAAVSVLYAFFLAVFVYREVKLSALPEMCLQTGITTAVIFMLIGTSHAMSWILAYENIPQSLSQSLLALSTNPLVILLLINGFLLFVGMFMDMTPAVLIFTPIFLPAAIGIDMHPIHFAIMLITNLCIGLCTPPVGTCLFVGCGVGKTSIARVTGPMLPFLGGMLVALALISLFPDISLWLPRQLGLR